MSNEKQNTPARQSRPEAIRVRRLTFSKGMDIPGSSMPNQLTAKDGQKNASRYHIEYQPWCRHHRVQWFEAGKDEPTTARMVHESKVDSCEPW
jgi:hypothetical protein